MSIAFAILFLLYFLVRIPFALVPGIDLFFETYVGTIAHEILNGLALPFLDYSADPYGGGTLIAAAWTTPFFAIFGETLFALKLAPLFWHLLSLMAWFFVWRARFPPYQTFLILLFFVLPPPRITEYTLLNQGTHFEMILWMALSLLIFRRFLDGRLSETKAGLLLGFLGGFSSCTILTNFITVAVIWIYLALVRETKIRKSLFYTVYIPAFLISFSPLLIYNAKYGWRGLEILHGLFLTPGYTPSYFLEQISFVLKIGLRGLFGFRDLTEIPKRIFMEGYTILYLLALGGLLFRRRNFFKQLKGGLDVEAFGIIFQLLLLFLTTVASWGYREYYFFPLVPFIGMTLVRGFQNWKLPRLFILFFCVLAGLVGNISFMIKRSPHLGVTLKTPGYAEGLLGYFIEARFGHDFELFEKKVHQALAGRSIEYQKEFFKKFTEGAFASQTPKDLEQRLSFIKTFDPVIQPILYQKFGIQYRGED